MKSVVAPWRDPAFFGFVLFGFALLCSGLICASQARSQHPGAARVAQQRPSTADLAPALFVTARLPQRGL